MDVRLFWRLYRRIPQRRARETLMMTAAIGCAFDKEAAERMSDMACPVEIQETTAKTAAEENEELARFLSQGTLHGRS